MRAAALLLFLALTGPAEAGVLVEGAYEGIPVTAEVGDDKSRVLITVAGQVRLIDLEAGTLGTLSGAGHPPRLPAQPWNPDLRVEALGGGTMVAGQFGTYRLVTEGARICGEILTSSWMKPFLNPIARALALVARDDPRLAPKPRYGCSPLGFALLSDQGWPLMASGRDAAIWQTTYLRFDHRPAWQDSLPPRP